MRQSPLFLLGPALAAALPIAAFASSEEAWEEHREAVRAACLALAGPDAAIEVNPFGSASYGVALLEVAGDRRVCILDKTTGAAELSEPFLPLGTSD